MSRTDAHAPSRVRLARGDLPSRPCHAAPHDRCDLPDRREVARWEAPRYLGPATSCAWEYRYAGVNDCPCITCHGGALARSRNRAGRRDDRASLKAALNAWRGGDTSAFDAVVPPLR
jgi:hypothetical protein